MSWQCKRLLNGMCCAIRPTLTFKIDGDQNNCRVVNLTSRGLERRRFEPKFRMTYGSGVEISFNDMTGVPYESLSMHNRFTGPSVCDVGILLRFCLLSWPFLLAAKRVQKKRYTTDELQRSAFLNTCRFKARSHVLGVRRRGFRLTPLDARHSSLRSRRVSTVTD